MLKAVNIRSVRKPKKYQKLNDHELSLLFFVSKSSSAAEGFPDNGRTWTTFKQEYGGPARANGIILPSLSSWNRTRKSRFYDVCANLSDAFKWWSNSRMQNNLLDTHPPPPESCSSGSMTLLVCPKRVPFIIQILRCHEIMTGLKNETPSDYHKGAHPCGKCHLYSIPRCFSARSTVCLSDVCRNAKYYKEIKKKENDK